MCVSGCSRGRRGGGTLAESLPLSTSLSICASVPPPPPRPRWWRVGWEDGPRALTHSHTSAMCHYSFHLPLPVIPRSPFHLPTLVPFPPSLSCLSVSFFMFSLSLYLLPSSFLTPSSARCVSPPPGRKKNALADGREKRNEKSQREG